MSSHVYLCTICGHKTGRLLTKGQCVVCRNKTLVMYASESSPEFQKKYRELRGIHGASSPTFSNLLVLIVLSVGVALVAAFQHYFGTWETARQTMASVPGGSSILQYMPERNPVAPPAQMASTSNTLH